MSEWYTKGLLAYMLGLSEDEVDRLMKKYIDEGGKEDPRALFAYLMRESREYIVMWAIMSYSDQISLLQVAIIGPDGNIVWTSQAALPYAAESISSSGWPTISNILTKGTSPLPESVNDVEFIAAQHVNQQLRKIWPDIAGDAYGEFLRKEESNLSDNDEECLSRERLMEFERRFREATGRTLPIVAFKFVKLSLPDLREKSVNLISLDNAITRYLTQLMRKEEDSSTAERESMDLMGSTDDVTPLVEVDPFVDPVDGVPLSELHPGDVIYVIRDEVEVPATIYMLRLLKDGQYEAHGTIKEADEPESKESYFRFISPGDIKVKVHEMHKQRGPSRALVVALLIVIFIFAAILFLPF